MTGLVLVQLLSFWWYALIFSILSSMFRKVSSSLLPYKFIAMKHLSSREDMGSVA
jgi:hypothetical protein